MSFFSKLFGGKNDNAVAVPAAASSAARTPTALSPAEEVLREIEKTEGELHEAGVNLAAAADEQIKTSLTALVQRKTQAIADLKEKLEIIRKSASA